MSRCHVVTFCLGRAEENGGLNPPETDEDLSSAPPPRGRGEAGGKSLRLWRIISAETDEAFERRLAAAGNTKIFFAGGMRRAGLRFERRLAAAGNTKNFFCGREETGGQDPFESCQLSAVSRRRTPHRKKMILNPNRALDHVKEKKGVFFEIPRLIYSKQAKSQLYIFLSRICV